MLIAVAGKSPVIDPQAFVAADATVAGDVTLGPGCRVMHGARIVAEAGGSIVLGDCCIVLENAVIRATAFHPCAIGNHCIIGPNSHVVGAEIGDEVFIATGASVFHGARIGKGSEVRINGVVHLKSDLPPGSTVPISWIAVGLPTEILSPDQHERIWELQKPLDFPGTVYGVDRNGPDVMQAIARGMSERLGMHRGEGVAG